MIGKVKLLSNYKELQEYDSVIAEYGEEEAFNLGKYTTPPVEKFIDSELLFREKDIQLAWVVTDDNGDKVINIQMYEADLWSLYHTNELWEEIKGIFNK
jgi:hypothetical protein